MTRETDLNDTNSGLKVELRAELRKNFVARPTLEDERRALSDASGRRMAQRAVKPRHAAALLLVLFAACAGPSVRTAQSTGWQIMHPPQAKGQPSGTLDETAPLSKWVGAPSNIDLYPSQKECEQMIETLREESSHPLCLSLPCSEDFHNSPEEVQRVAKQAAKNDDMLRCVSISDPRLKEK